MRNARQQSNYRSLSNGNFPLKFTLCLPQIPSPRASCASLRKRLGNEDVHCAPAVTKHTERALNVPLKAPCRDHINRLCEYLHLLFYVQSIIITPN